MHESNNFVYVSSHRGKDIFLGSDEYYYIDDDFCPFESLAEAKRWVDLNTDRMVQYGRIVVLIEAGITFNELPKQSLS